MGDGQNNFFERSESGDRYIYSQSFLFEERGGYFVNLKFVPKNFFYKLLVNLGILKIKEDIYISAVNVKNETDFRYGYTKYSPTECKGILILEKAEYGVSITVPSFNLTFFKTDLSIRRMDH